MEKMLDTTFVGDAPVFINANTIFFQIVVAPGYFVRHSYCIITGIGILENATCMWVPMFSPGLTYCWRSQSALRQH